MPQLRLDFDERRAIMRSLILQPGRPGETGDARPVSAAMLYSVLSVLVDRSNGKAECFVSHATIAQQIQRGSRTVRRALNVLHNRSLITIERRRTPSGTTCHHYRIVWSELALLARPRRHQSPARPAASDVQRGAKPSGKPPPTKWPPAPTMWPPAPDHVATVATEGTKEGSIRRPPPPTPHAPAPTPEQNQGEGAEGVRAQKSEDQPAASGGLTWGDVAGRLRSLGLSKASAAVRAARERGAAASDVWEACDTFAAPDNRRKFQSAGALLEWSKTGEWPVGGVVPAAELQRRKVQRSRQAVDLEAERKRSQQVADPDLERLYGATLDAMPPAAVHQLAAGESFLVDRIRKYGVEAATVRPILLARLRRLKGGDP